MTRRDDAHHDDRRRFQGEALPHLDALYGKALSLARDPSRAEDLVQETMLRAYQKWGQFQAGTNCRAWLMRILTNTFINHYRRRTKEREILDREEVGAYGDRFFARDQARSWACPERAFRDRRLSSPVVAAIEALRPEFREVLVLSDLEGLAYREIAEAVGCPIGTVMSRLFRARRALRGRLRGHARELGVLGAATAA